MSTAIVGFGVGGFAIAQAADRGDGPSLDPVQLEQVRDASVNTTPSVASLESPSVVAPAPVTPPTVAPAPAPPPPPPPPAPVHDSPDTSWSVASPASADSVDSS